MQIRSSFFATAGSLSLILLFLNVQPSSSIFKAKASTDKDNFDRAQNLVINLNRVEGSSGWYLLEGMRFCRDMDHHLTKAMRQVQEVDSTYARLRGRPDNKYLDTTAIKIDRAIQANQQLNADLKDAFAELKAQIQETIVLDPGSKKK